jgi:hypothetical protein
MSHFSKSCPTCKRVLPLLCASCPQCDSRTEEARSADEAYNHMITIGVRISAIACALVVAAAISSRGRRPEWSDYRLIVMLSTVSAVSVWCALRALCGTSRRSLWRTALIPAFLIVAGVFVMREVHRMPMPAAVDASAAVAREDIKAASLARPRTSAPLSQVADECFAYVNEQAAKAASEVAAASIGAMLDPEAKESEAIAANRARLAKLDERMRQIHASIRKTQADLSKRVRALGALPPGQAVLAETVAASARNVCSSAAQSVMSQRRVIARAQEILRLCEDQSAPKAGGAKQIIINGSANREFDARLLAQWSEAERAAARALDLVQQNYDQARQRIRAAGSAGSLPRASTN